MIRRLLLAAAVCAVLSAVAGPAALVACVTALAAAGVLAMRAGWAAHGDPPPVPDRAEHLAAVDAALDEGRLDLARDLSRSYRQQARRQG